MELIARKEAKAQGLKRYFTGKPCSRGHVNERIVSSGACLTCASENQARYISEDPERYRATFKRYWVNLGSERKAKLLEHNREKSKVWAAENKDHLDAYGKAYREANKERRAENDRAYREQNRSRKLVMDKAWKQANHARVIANAKHYKLTKRNAVPAWANREAIVSLYDEAARLTTATGVLHHVDHIIPLRGKTVSGLHVETNLRVITARENMSKGNRYVAISL